MSFACLSCRAWNFACRSRRSKLVDKQQSSSNVRVKTKELSSDRTHPTGKRMLCYETRNVLACNIIDWKKTGSRRLHRPLPWALDHRLHITTVIPNKNRSPRGFRPYSDRLLSQKLSANRTAYSKIQFKFTRIIESHVLTKRLLQLMHLPFVRPPTKRPPNSPVDEGH